MQLEEKIEEVGEVYKNKQNMTKRQNITIRLLNWLHNQKRQLQF